VELPLSLLSPPAVGTSNAASTSSTAAQQANAVPVVTVKKENKKKHHLTTATDPLFSELRDVNFSSIGKKLNKVARRLDEDYKVSHLILVTCISVSKLGVKDESPNENRRATTRFRGQTWWSSNRTSSPSTS
jgi:hypothetical protein